MFSASPVNPPNQPRKDAVTLFQKSALQRYLSHNLLHFQQQREIQGGIRTTICSLGASATSKMPHSNVPAISLDVRGQGRAWVQKEHGKERSLQTWDTWGLPARSLLSLFPSGTALAHSWLCILEG